MINQRALGWVSCFIVATSTACSAVVTPLPPQATPIATPIATPTFVVDSAHPITREESITVTNPITPTDSASAPNPQVEQAINDLAARTSSAPTAIEVVDFAYVVWPDKGLGCPQPGMIYAQVQQDGLLIHLRVSGDSSGVIYAYHSGEGRPPFLCETPAPSAEGRPPKDR